MRITSGMCHVGIYPDGLRRFDSNHLSFGITLSLSRPVRIPIGIRSGKRLTVDNNHRQIL